MKFKAWMDKHGRFLGFTWIFLLTAIATPVFDHAPNPWAWPVVAVGQLYCFWYSWLRFIEVRWAG